jgi:hypothetical protein
MLTGHLRPNEEAPTPTFFPRLSCLDCLAVGALASLETKNVSVEPGNVATVRVKVQNTGQIVDEFVIDVLGDAAAWASSSPPMVRLFPGQEEVATISFRPARAADVRSGDVPFAVRVQPRQDPQGTTVEEGVVSVGAFIEAGAELIPRNSRGSRSGVHEVAVDNRGNASLQATLTATDQDKQLDFRFSPSSLAVGAGTAGFARLRVRPRQTFWRGQPKSRAFQVRVQPEGKPPISLDGTLIQGPLISPWMLPATLGLIAALIALTVLWFLAVKPGIESVARNAVISPSPVAAVSGGGGGGGKSPSPGPATASPTAPSASGANFSRRLAPGQNQFKVPVGVTLYITDLVFQNPASEAGQVETLQRDGQILLSENTDNFRDLDYHFVTPIQINPNQTIALQGGCKQCSVLVSGYQKTN